MNLKFSKTVIITLIFSTIIFAQNNEKKFSFSAMNDQGKTWKSSDIKSPFLVVYFYPAAMTYGCTKQACSYRDDIDALKKLGATVVGISGDDVSNLKNFKKVYHLNFTLLSDSSGKLAKLFGVPTKKGGDISKTIKGENYFLHRNITASRWTFILNNKREIIYKNEEVNAEEDSKTIKEILMKK
ncbi:MAG: peroxiredoxin [Lutibacter sp.]